MENLNQVYKKFSKEGNSGIAPFISKTHSTEDIIHNLLALHIDKIDFFTSLIKKQNTTYNELFDFLAEYPDELRFCKQLFTHRENPEMNLVFLYGINAVKPIVLSLITSHFKISEYSEYFDSVWMTMVESWYSRLDVNNLTAKHMKDISEETAEIIIKLNKL
ncbi:MAG: hypothetical protein KAR19_02390 [Bacteroidales bacterium]|nr:hypothetical protein [Bacteroidales bacterium]